MTRQIVIKLNHKKYYPLIERNMLTSRSVSEYVAKLVLMTDYVLNHACEDGMTFLDKLAECQGMTRDQLLVFINKYYADFARGN